MASTSIDVGSLHAALDSARASQQLSWRQLAARLDLSPSTFSRIANGHTPDTAAFASIVKWLRVPAESFMHTEGEEPDSEGDPDLVAQLAPLLRARTDLTLDQIQHIEQLIGSAVHHFDQDRRRRDA